MEAGIGYLTLTVRGMRDKLILWLCLAVLGLAIFSSVQQYRLGVVKEEKERLGNNQIALLEEINTYKVRVGKDSLNAASVRALKLELSEVKRYRSQDASLIKDLGVKLKYAKAVFKNSSKTENNFSALVRDSVVYLPGRVDTLRCVTHKDKWFEFDGCMDKQNKFTGHAASIDTLVGIPNIIPKKFLFFRWGVKAIQFTAVNKNPNSKIYFQEYYDIK